MSDQIFNAPVGQVAGGNINNHSRWDAFTIEELLKFKKEYSKERTKAVLSEYFNKYLAVFMVVLALFGWWGSYMIQSSGLTGDIPPLRLAVLAGFMIAGAAPCLALRRLRQGARATVAEIDGELTKINQGIRFKKSKR